jgi:Sec-independent protein translocase protein TatA
MIQNGNSTPADKSGQFDHDAAVRMIGKIISFLRNLTTETLAKRIVSIVLIVVGVSNDRVAELTGLCGRSVRELRKKIKDGNADDGLFHAGGGGRKGKLKDIETDNYHTQQETDGMAYDEYGIRVHRTVVGKPLKKTKSNG